jgi:hypothetical protein
VAKAVTGVAGEALEGTPATAEGIVAEVIAASGVVVVVMEGEAVEGEVTAKVVAEAAEEEEPALVVGGMKALVVEVYLVGKTDDRS